MKILNKAAGVAGRRLRPAEGVATNAVGARQYVVSSICRNVDLAAKLVRQI